MQVEQSEVALGLVIIGMFTIPVGIILMKRFFGKKSCPLCGKPMKKTTAPAHPDDDAEPERSCTWWTCANNQCHHIEEVGTRPQVRVRLTPS